MEHAGALQVSVSSMHTRFSGGQGLPGAVQSVFASQNSTPLQYKPSSGQLASLGSLTQASPASSQESSVQPIPSSQLTAVPAWQPLARSQVSTPEQNKPSSHTASSGTFWQSLTGSQVSVVHATRHHRRHYPLCSHKGFLHYRCPLCRKPRHRNQHLTDMFPPG